MTPPVVAEAMERIQYALNSSIDPKREDVEVMLSYISSQEAEIKRLEAVADGEWLDGTRVGWNFAQANNHDGLEFARASRRHERSQYYAALAEVEKYSATSESKREGTTAAEPQSFDGGGEL